MDELKRRARAAYERSRIALGLRRAALVLPFLVVAAVLGEPTREVPVGLSVMALAGALSWYGRDAGRGVLPGLLAGSVAFLAPLVARFTGLVALGCGATPSCIAASVAGGLGAGVLVALVTRGRAPSLVAGLVLIAGLAALTCLPLGGTALLAAGSAAAISAPVVRLVRPATA